MAIAPNGYNPPYASSGFQMPIPNNQQVVIPQITIPNAQTLLGLQPQVQPTTPPVDLNRVKGMDGAKQFIMGPNSRIAMFDEDDDVFYIKQTDNNNYPVSLKRYRFYEEEEPAPMPPSEYATKDDLNNLMKANDERYVSLEKMDELFDAFKALREEIANAKQPVRSTSSGTSSIKRNTATSE